MTQLAVELRRFSARRIVRGAAVLTVLIMVTVVGVMTVAGHEGRTVELRPPVPVPGTMAPPVVSLPDGTIIELEDEGSYRDGGYYREEADTRVKVGEMLPNAIEGVGLAMLFVAFVLGASFVGAEFNVGSLTTQLLFEPRRWRVHGAKAAAVGLGAALLSWATSALLAGTMYAGSSVNGVVEGIDAGWWADRAGDASRIAAVVGLGAVLAYSATLVMKRSSAGIIAFVAQFPLLPVLSPTSEPFGFVSHYAPLRALLAVVADPAGDHAVFDAGIRTMAGGVTLSLAWTAAAVLVAGAVFSRAEVR